MRLYEEYFKRHQIRDVPLVHHNANSCVFFKCRDNHIWSDILGQPSFYTASNATPSFGIFEVKWVYSDHHPGHYEAAIHYQIPDGHVKDQVFGIHHITTIRWSEYESFVYHFCKKLTSVNLIRDKDLAFITGWEMFVSSYDSFLQKQSGDIKYLLFQTLDDENSNETRIAYISEILRKFSCFSPMVLRNWKNEVLNKVQNHSNWLVNIIDKHAKEILPNKD